MERYRIHVVDNEDAHCDGEEGSPVHGGLDGALAHVGVRMVDGTEHRTAVAAAAAALAVDVEALACGPEMLWTQDSRPCVKQRERDEKERKR